MIDRWIYVDRVNGVQKFSALGAGNYAFAKFGYFSAHTLSEFKKISWYHQISDALSWSQSAPRG